MEAETERWHTWKSGSDVSARWRRQPAPKDPNRKTPMVSAFWVPPSEDPHYKKKWADWKARMAAEEADPVAEITEDQTFPVTMLSNARRMRGVR